MSETIPFTFENHKIRTVVIDGIPWWVAKDVASALGYKDTKKAILQHCRGGRKTLLQKQMDHRNRSMD